MSDEPAFWFPVKRPAKTQLPSAPFRLHDFRRSPSLDRFRKCSWWRARSANVWLPVDSVCLFRSHHLGLIAESAARGR